MQELDSVSKECAMLVLTRKLQEQIRIGDDVTITIMRIRGNTVRIGIEAPRDKRVIRSELPALEKPLDAAGTEVSFELEEQLPRESEPPEGAVDACGETRRSPREMLSLKDRLVRHWPTPATR
jgi:carbon storage regulator CsrA